ncbi:hypothetical protein CEXT_14231 [Caerostris extrusa]|uniref:Uncharacterized protein n=1 Tax=Caerostris extrusa TaxID=172846 RepID=A0AAV4MG43_CAEEX|nr:hypothetical protein CEXT_14231 [Caerostris extrusa]
MGPIQSKLFRYQKHLEALLRGTNTEDKYPCCVGKISINRVCYDKTVGVDQTISFLLSPSDITEIINLALPIGSKIKADVHSMNYPLPNASPHLPRGKSQKKLPVL